jgi:hypothetical protein
VSLQVQQTPGATPDPNFWRRRAADQSDQNGRYFIQGVAQGRYVLTVNMGQKGQGTTQISVSGQDTVMQDLQVLPTGKVAFNVVDADGNPIEKVYFSFHDPERQSRWLGWAMWTNVQGFSTSGPVRQGVVLVKAYHYKREFEVDPFHVTVEPQKTVTMNVVMKKKEKKKKPDPPAR